MPEIILKQKLNNEFLNERDYKKVGEWLLDYLLYFECDLKPIPDGYEISIEVKKK